MATYLSIDDGLMRALGYLDDADSATIARMTMVLAAAEHYVQGAIGESTTFYTSADIKELYTLACNSLAVTWFNAAGDTGDTSTAQQIIGQLRGSYSEVVANNDTTEDSQQA